jgi:putative endopeptidase
VQGAINSLLGDAVGQLYAKKFFPPEEKADVLEIVSLITESVRTRIGNADWMSESTSEKALENSRNENQDRLPRNLARLLSSLEISSKKVAVIHKWGNDAALKKINQPVDKDQWTMTL